MSSPPLLNGEVLDIDSDLRDVLINDLRAETVRLESEIRRLKSEVTRYKFDADRAKAAITMLQGQLSGLYRAMKAIFGEIEPIVGEQSPQRSERDPEVPDAIGNLDKWEAIKKRLGGRDAELIEILLTMGPKTNTQLAPLLKCHYSRATAATKRLANLGFLEKQGDSWSLKQ